MAKALQKYPPGTGNRWKLVSGMLPGKKQADVVKKAQEAKGNLVKEVKKTEEQSKKDAFDKLKEQNKEASAKVNDYGTTVCFFFLLLLFYTFHSVKFFFCYFFS